MFTLPELMVIGKALEQARASAKRLSLKEGQPEKVAQEYAAYEITVSHLQTKVAAAVGELTKKK